MLAAFDDHACVDIDEKRLAAFRRDGYGRVVDCCHCPVSYCLMSSTKIGHCAMQVKHKILQFHYKKLMFGRELFKSPRHHSGAVGVEGVCADSARGQRAGGSIADQDTGIRRAGQHSFHQSRKINRSHNATGRRTFHARWKRCRLSTRLQRSPFFPCDGSTELRPH